MTIQFNEGQKEAINKLDADVCVRAGAGTGKTTVLVERYVNLVESRRVRPTNILALTYTHKAAFNMKRKLSNRFMDLTDRSLRQELELADISTIHSFCNRVLRENAISLGIDPEFILLDQDQQRLFVSRCYLDWLKGVYEVKDEKLVNLIIAYGRDYIRDIILSGLRHIRGYGYSFPQQPDIELSMHKTKAIEEFNHAFDQYSLAVSKRSKTSDNQLHQLNQISRIAEYINGIVQKKPADMEMLRTLDQLKEPTPKKKTYRKNTGKDLKEYIGDLEKAHNGLSQVLAEELFIPIKQKLQHAILDFNEFYRKALRDQGRMDYDELLILLRDSLKNNDYLRGKLQDRYRYIMVDEFQDTNYLQREIFDLIRSPDNFFAVGDVKQSIYEFTNADVRVFLELQSEMENAGKKPISLVENFRSTSSIIGFVNCFSDRLFEGTDIRYEALRLPSDQAIMDEPSVLVLLSRCDEGEGINDARELEARCIAELIKSMKNGDCALLGDNKYALDYKDFALLFRATTSIGLYEDALREADIPYFVISGGEFYNRQEVIDIINLLSFLENRRDDLALMAVLKSRLVSLDDSAIFWLADAAGKHDDGNKPLYKGIKSLLKSSRLDNEQRSRLEHFDSFVEQISCQITNQSVWRLIEHIIEQFDYASRVRASEWTIRGYSNLIKLIESAIRFENAGYSKLEDFTRYIKELRAGEIRAEEAQTAAEGEAVCLYTIHKAKGLEFPVAIIPDIFRKVDHQASKWTSRITYTRDFGLTMKLIDDIIEDRSYEPQTHIQAKEEAKQRTLQEEKRLLYVAMTRAKKYLVLSGAHKKELAKEARNDTSHGAWLFNFLDLPGTTPCVQTYRDENDYTSKVIIASFDNLLAGSEIPQGVELAAKEKYIQPDKELSIGQTPVNRVLTISGHGKNTYRRLHLSITDILDYRYCPYLYKLKQDHGLSNDPFSVSSIGESLGARTDFGSAMHNLLEREDWHLWQTDSQLPQEIVSGYLMDPKESDQALELLKALISSPFIERVRAATIVQKELPLSVLFDPATIRGDIDMVTIDAGGFVSLYDYKSDRISKSKIRRRSQRYRNQLLLYAVLYKKVFGITPEEVGIYYLYTASLDAMTLDDSMIASAEDWLNEVISGISLGAFEPEKNRDCRECWLKKVCYHAL